MAFKLYIIYKQNIFFSSFLYICFEIMRNKVTTSKKKDIFFSCNSFLLFYVHHQSASSYTFNLISLIKSKFILF